MVDDDLVPFQHPRQDFSAQGKAVGGVQVASEVLLHISVRLAGLVIDRREPGMLAEYESIDSGSYDVKMLFQPLDERKEYFVRDAEARQQEQRRPALFSVNVEFHRQI